MNDHLLPFDLAPDAHRRLQVEPVGAFRFTVPRERLGLTEDVPARGDALRHVVDAAVTAWHDHPGPALVAVWIQQYAKSANTRDAYASDIERWIGWLAAEQVPLLGVTRVHVGRWLDQEANAVDDDGEPLYATSTIKRRLSSISSFYTFVHDHEIIDRNPCRGAKFKADVRRPTAAMTEAQVAALLDQARRTSTLDWLLVALLYFGGLRVSEVTAARRNHLTSADGTRLLLVRGKGDKTRKIPVDGRDNPITAPLLSHLAERERGGIDSPWLLADDDGSRLTRHQITYRLDRLAREAGGFGDGDRATPHRLRKSFATHAVARGVSTYHLQLAMGHEDPKTTLGYVEDETGWRNHPAALLADVGHSPGRG